MINIKNIKIEASLDQDKYLKNKIIKKLNVEEIDNYKIIKRSIDARNKSEIFYVYEVNVKVNKEGRIVKDLHDKNVTIAKEEKYKEVKKKKDNDLNIIIVGSGPAGLFTAYTLAMQGIKATLIERGEEIDKRVKKIEDFFSSNNLDVNSNIQFGEGGAGTFSDGKLNTLTKDPNCRSKFVLETFVKFGAPKEILYESKPHIGTDILRIVIKNMRIYLEEHGITFLFNTKLEDIVIKNNKINEIITNKGNMNVDILILAIGHSARDTFIKLSDHLDMESKPFSVGLRIIHSQDMINESQYGKYKDILPPCSYKLTYQSSLKHGVYSFCMCPGGFVVNASSEKGMLAINGMSNYKRNENTANSAIVVTVSKDDFGPNLFDGMNFQRNLERKAYDIGGTYIPIQLLKDYEQNIKSVELGTVKPNIKGKYKFANLNELFPDSINKSLKEAFPYFDSKIKGFNSKDAILAGIESRTSSPIKIIRNEEFESNIKGIYPIGEGAGYAGGIMTAAIDGIKCSENIIQKYYR